MKKRAIISYLLALTLLLSSCGYVPQENTEGSSDPALQESEITQPTTQIFHPQPTHNWELSDVSEPTFTEEDITYTENGIIAGPFTFEYIDEYYNNYHLDFSSDELIHLQGLNLVSCEVNTSEVVIPSEVCGMPVVAIAYGYIYQELFDRPHFIQNTPLRALYIPDTVLYIALGALHGCTALSEIRLSGSIGHLGTYDSDACEEFLDGTSVVFLEVPEGVTDLGYYSLSYSNVEYLVLPSTLTDIWTNSISDCPLKVIYLRAARENYSESLLEEIDEQTDATLYFYSENEPSEEGNFWRYVEGKPVIW